MHRVDCNRSIMSAIASQASADSEPPDDTPVSSSATARTSRSRSVGVCLRNFLTPTPTANHNHNHKMHNSCSKRRWLGPDGPYNPEQGTRHATTGGCINASRAVPQPLQGPPQNLTACRWHRMLRSSCPGPACLSHDFGEMVSMRRAVSYIA